MQLSENFELNSFTLDYCDLQIKVFCSNLQHYGTTQAVMSNCSNFEIWLDCSAMNGI